MNQWHIVLLLTGFGMFCAYSFLSLMTQSWAAAPNLFAVDTPPTYGLGEHDRCEADLNVSLDWHPPKKTDINNLERVIDGDGVYGFIFDSSEGPPDTYNWCNMPHVNARTYQRAADEYELEYVEVVHRHHKRTPYASNVFPKENYEWSCDDERLFFGGEPIAERGSARTYWQLYTSESNPLMPAGFGGTCQFPQITGDGLLDSSRHGADIAGVYRELLNFIPSDFDENFIAYRVTNNVITSQVASQVIAGMWEGQEDIPHKLLVQPPTVDSLEPKYACLAADRLFASYGPRSSSDAWNAHLRQSADLKKRLDELSGIDPDARDWRMSWDHYFDNLSARLCHRKPLPCNIDDPTDCVTRKEADKVFRLGEYEYSFIYRDSEESLRASVASYGIWLGELANNLRSIASGKPAEAGVRFRYNIAHDGSVARLLSILQLDEMVWPGMGAEVVFELYRKDSEVELEAPITCYYLRVLWGGRALRSSHPALGTMDMIPLGTFLAYIDALVGVGGEKIPAMCRGTL